MSRIPTPASIDAPFNAVLEELLVRAEAAAVDSGRAT